MTNIPEHGIILKMILNKDIYNKYISYINLNYVRETYPDIYTVFEVLRSFRERYPDSSSTEDFHAHYLVVKNPNEKERTSFEDIFRCIVESTISESSVENLLGSMARKATLHQMAVASFEAITDETRYQDVVRLGQLLTEGATSSISASEWEPVTDDLEQLYNEAVKTKGLRWPLASLNRSLGSLRRGDFGFVFARPETGKTTFLCHTVTHMAGQTESPIAWFNNEEQGSKVQLRNYQAVLALPLEKLLASTKKHKAEYLKLTRGNIKLYDNAIISRSDVERICKEISPALIVFDQIDKIGGFQADREDLKLGSIYQWARELAKTYAPVIGICQSDGTGEGQKWLTMANVANAKTSKQAEADWILGIGRQNDTGFEFVRHFHVSKNKLIGDEDSDPEMRHGKWDVLIEPTLARYRDVIDYSKVN